MTAITVMPMTVDEYVQQELRSERRHEFVNGNLFEMPGEKITNNRMAGAFYVLLLRLLGPRGYEIYNHDIKVAIPGGKKYYYPDVFATAEPENVGNLYIMNAPALIIEVVSESSHNNDYVDKYLDYIRIPSLQYYLIAEPETVLVTVYERDTDNWVLHKYTHLDDIIQLPKLNIALPLSEVYATLKR